MVEVEKMVSEGRNRLDGLASRSGSYPIEKLGLLPLVLGGQTIRFL